MLAVAVWLMLVNDVVLGPWLLALLVLAHGWVHLMFVFPKPPRRGGDYASASEYPFDFGRSWLVRRAGLEAGLVRIIGIVLMAVVFAPEPAGRALHGRPASCRPTGGPG